MLQAFTSFRPYASFHKDLFSLMNRLSTKQKKKSLIAVYFQLMPSSVNGRRWGRRFQSAQVTRRRVTLFFCPRPTLTSLRAADHCAVIVSCILGAGNFPCPFPAQSVLRTWIGPSTSPSAPVCCCMDPSHPLVGFINSGLSKYVLPTNPCKQSSPFHLPKTFHECSLPQRSINCPACALTCELSALSPAALSNFPEEFFSVFYFPPPQPRYVTQAKWSS